METPDIQNYSVCQAFSEIVPRTGVEPVISALKGRRPRPLDERGTSRLLCANDIIVPHHGYAVKQSRKSRNCQNIAFGPLAILYYIDMLMCG